MLVTLSWLSRYVDITLTHDELVDRLSLSGLNHEGSETVDGEVVIDLEVTSNRGDCLGHIGVAREIGVLTGQKLKLPTIEFPESPKKISDLLTVRNEFTEACPRYTARVIRGVRVGDSPEWMQKALKSIGIGVVNNVVDVTNYVMMECGQPLHAFDAAKVAKNTIVVRPGRKGEKLEAIDHRNYDLTSETCVIADAESALAIAGVMGGASSEVTEQTTDLVIEAADFTPLSVRRTARRLKLHSPSSFRFERRVDPRGIDWASRRACQLITEIAGGSVASGVIDTDGPIADREPIVLRLSQLSRVLGIDIDAATVERILKGLGCHADFASVEKDASTGGSANSLQCVPPTWRHDLTREADLIEEVARIHGYDQIPEDSPIPVTPSSKRPFDSAMSRLRGVLTAAGLSEAMTPSVVTEKIDGALSPWTDRPAMQTRTAMLEGSRRLRRSLIPSLLQSRAANWASASINAELFEIAHVYLPPADGTTGTDALPAETYHVGLITGDDFFATKGIIECLLERLGITGQLQVETVQRDGFAPGGAVELKVEGHHETLGYLGLLDDGLVRSWKLPGKCVAAELSADLLVAWAHLVPQQQQISSFPSIRRDLNLVLPESVRWDSLSGVIRSAADERLTDLSYQETYRNEKQDGPDRKRVLFSMELQSLTETMSGSDADSIVENVVTACEKKLSAVLMR
ncbi:phenylalanine--tRNA ligase subunit beta [Aporhodopirellula aestuarii]|uniref:Phenylalanine--tRNA ligase beta subunit n=1 Tax=Aporhodopirellula aestuarii TaxID=2950107 RepID=A0ABT0UB35_9BACT|nr:phenylalanine--tRNA ligase subunit beta [Aporhodopirellula aestuarii]MCM2373541.1 phenylalanine--tRNA ligase subunit beta [Aporhodopirellula aestuarii]